jgi:hypothetical protein
MSILQFPPSEYFGVSTIFSTGWDENVLASFGQGIALRNTILPQRRRTAIVCTLIFPAKVLPFYAVTALHHQRPGLRKFAHRVTGMTTISTRRFSCRPCSVVFEARGRDSP